MRVSWKSIAGWLMPLCYLALPNCTFTPPGPSDGPNLERGALPRRTVVFCDVEKPLGRHCARQKDLDLGIPLAQAAVALRKGEKSTIGLDFSPAARARCNGGPEAVTFECSFPNGCEIGMNCDQIGEGKKYRNETAVCRDFCADLFGEQHPNGAFVPENPPDPLVVEYCRERARASTNFTAPCSDFFYIGACNDEGVLLPTFEDPRRHLEAVHWRHRVGVTTSGAQSNTLIKVSPGAGAFDAGAASEQTITRGDAFVEFTAVSVDHARALGFSVGAASPEAPDTDPTLAGIGFAVRLSPAGLLFIHEGSDQEIPGGNPNGSFATYASGDRIRIELIDNNTSPRTATIRYLLVPAGCTGPTCGGVVLRTAGPARYPFRVDASLRNQGAQLDNVGMVRIK